MQSRFFPLHHVECGCHETRAEFRRRSPTFVTSNTTTARGAVDGEPTSRSVRDAVLPLPHPPVAMCRASRSFLFETALRSPRAAETHTGPEVNT